MKHAREHQERFHRGHLSSRELVRQGKARRDFKQIRRLVCGVEQRYRRASPKPATNWLLSRKARRHSVDRQNHMRSFHCEHSRREFLALRKM
jgi:hypothetical protein